MIVEARRQKRLIVRMRARLPTPAPYDSAQTPALNRQSMVGMSEVTVNLSADDLNRFGQRPLIATHSMQNHELFTDKALAELLDRFPREHLYALTMGTDATRTDDNRLALHDGVSGAELLRAVRNGRLWLNVTGVDRADARYRALIDDLYSQLAAGVPGFVPTRMHGTLLISSPHAMVYYHADGPASVLWHIRGHKRIWIYPPLDERYMKRELLEDIFAGVRHEYLPYDPGFDAAAVSYELAPGQWATWPQNAPHRVTNLADVNVSLSTEHFTAATEWRQRVYVANRFFRTHLGRKNLAAREAGPAAMLKIAVYSAANRLGLAPIQYRRHVPVLRIDADAPDGVTALADAGHSVTACTP
jgi:hypothetical protein